MQKYNSQILNQIFKIDKISNQNLLCLSNLQKLILLENQGPQYCQSGILC
jgi:hypothetical protein